MSTNRFADADTAFRAGDTEKGIQLTAASLEADPAAPVGVYRNFASLLFRHKRYAEAEQWAQAGTKLFPRDFDLWNILGVACRRQQKYEDAIKALERAEKISPKNTSAISNRGNVYNDMRNGPGAIEAFTKLVRLQPGAAEFQRGLGRGYWFSRDLDKALTRLRLATKLKPDFVDAWLDVSAVVSEKEGPASSLPVIEQALALNPDSPRLREAKALAMRRSGRLRDTEAYLQDLLGELGELGWIHYQIAGVISDYDRERANVHYAKAIELAPSKVEYKVAYAESLSRSRHGDESDHIEAAYQVLRGALDEMGELNASQLKVALEILTRLADYDAAEALGGFSEVGDRLVDGGKMTALLAHLARIRSDEDRVELLEMHRRGGRRIIDGAKRFPISAPPPRAPNGKIRLGIMSSDLRNHPVAYFAMPLFDHLPRDRFEVYCYSYFEGDKADPVQTRIAAAVDAFRWEKDITDHAAAQMIADDQLDMLLELGGSTYMNKLNVMAFKPAPLSGSWLGYPHSAGLETIDHLILDPYVAPTRSELLVEEPLLMPKSWIAMGEMAFPERPITEGTPEQRNGFLTFGTANNPYKYSREMVQTWARITASTPNARFLFIRPEGGAPSFRSNMQALFAAEGVSEERLRFVDIRGAHMPYYNEMDIALDTFPQTGGTTTCETLWMGVPVVTLAGEAMFERLSYSILTNAGLGDLCARTREEYVEIALKLAADPARRAALRTDLRGMLKASPLGQTKQFAADFYDMIEGAVLRARASGKIPAAA
jgi:predicted O-linked N-acetylglucosamine transferase (SPINDLY family)